MKTKISSLVKKTNYDAKLREIGKKLYDYNHDKYITTQEFNKLTADNFAARLKQANLATKSDIDDIVKKTNFYEILKNLNKKLLRMKQNI